MEEERKEREEWVIIRRQEPRQMKQGSRKSSIRKTWHASTMKEVDQGEARSIPMSSFCMICSLLGSHH